MPQGPKRQRVANIKFQLKSAAGRNVASGRNIQRIEAMFKEVGEEVRARVFEDFYALFRALAGARIERYRQSGTSLSPGPTDTPATGNLFRSIDKKIDSRGSMIIFCDRGIAPYAGVHDLPEGDYTPIIAQNSPMLRFFWHREGRWAYFKPPAYVKRPGTGFFTTSFGEVSTYLDDIYEDVKAEVFAKYNKRGKGPLKKRRR